ncbi:MAG: hypothetical protein F6K41_24110 [Symploca sp. SIO3E6]|nr:hypothetical protein [Caldora sp. SIO3E6]
METLVAQSALNNLPPSVDSAPAELQPELLQMQALSKEALLEIAQSQIDPVQYQRHLQLLDKNKDDKLEPAERQELTQLRKCADYLTLRKAYAWAVLRWQGHRVPAVNELPIPLARVVA